MPSRARHRLDGAEELARGRRGVLDVVRFNVLLPLASLAPLSSKVHHSHHGRAAQRQAHDVDPLRGVYQRAQGVERDARALGISGGQRRNDAPGERSRKVKAMGGNARDRRRSSAVSRGFRGVR